MGSWESVFGSELVKWTGDQPAVGTTSRQEYILLPCNDHSGPLCPVVRNIYAHSACLSHRIWCAVITHNPRQEFLTLPYHSAVLLYFLSLKNTWSIGLTTLATAYTCPTTVHLFAVRDLLKWTLINSSFINSDSDGTPGARVTESTPRLKIWLKYDKCHSWWLTCFCRCI